MAHGDVKSIVDSPWTSVGTSDTGREYLVLLTYLPLKGYRKMMTLMRRSRAVSHQLAKTPGLIGFTFRAKLFRHRFWTLSAWEDEKASWISWGRSRTSTPSGACSEAGSMRGPATTIMRSSGSLVRAIG